MQSRSEDRSQGDTHKIEIALGSNGDDAYWKEDFGKVTTHALIVPGHHSSRGDVHPQLVRWPKVHEYLRTVSKYLIVAYCSIDAPSSIRFAPDPSQAQDDPLM